MNISNTTVSDLNDAVAKVEDLVRNDMRSQDHNNLQQLESLIQRIDMETLASGQNFVAENRLEEVRNALNKFLDGMLSS